MPSTARWATLSEGPLKPGFRKPAHWLLFHVDTLCSRCGCSELRAAGRAQEGKALAQEPPRAVQGAPVRLTRERRRRVVSESVESREDVSCRPPAGSFGQVPTSPGRPVWPRAARYHRAGSGSRPGPLGCL